jgi:hypothetical protein
MMLDIGQQDIQGAGKVKGLLPIWLDAWTGDHRNRRRGSRPIAGNPQRGDEKERRCQRQNLSGRRPEIVTVH